VGRCHGRSHRTLSRQLCRTVYIRKSQNHVELIETTDIFIASLSASGALMLRNIRLDHLSVGRFAVYCGKTADWIWMPFGMVSGIGQEMGVLDRGGYHRWVRGSFLGIFGASHCNQWGLCCIVVQLYINRSICHLAW